MQLPIKASSGSFAIVLLAGCTGMSEKFISTEKVNFEPFATTTIQMVNTVDYGIERNETKLTRKYLTPKGKPELQRLIELDDELYRVLSGIVAYSVKIVNLFSSKKTPEQQVQAFADYIENLDKPALELHILEGNVTEQDYLDMLENIRQQEDLLAAMRAAQPLIQFIAQHIDALAEEIKDRETKAALEIEKAIDKDYAKEIAYVNMLSSRRDVVIDALITIDKHYKGNKDALNKLNESNVLFRLGLKARKIVKSNVKQVEKELVVTIDEIQRQLNLMESDSNYYLKVHLELDRLLKSHDEEIRKARGVIQLWSGAHNKMANGITDPADWFDVTNPGGEFFNLVKTVISR